jgi:uncharacterized small protein (DUF1192 family)
MPAIDEDDKPKKKVAHEIGQELTLLSVEELGLRVQLLHDEINRLEADMAQNARRAPPPISFQALNRSDATAGIPVLKRLKIFGIRPSS